MINEKKLFKYKKSLESAWGFNDYNDWPIKYNSIMHLFLNDFTKEFLEDFRTLKTLGVANQDIAKAFYNPSRIYRIIHTVIYGMKSLKYSASEQKEVATELLDITSLMKFGSAFNEDGKNIIFDSSNLETVVNKAFVKVKEVEESAKLHKVFGILWAYTEAIFFRAHDVTKEIHGLYDLERSSLLVREYMNLRPKKLWNEVDIGCSKIKVYTKYSKDINIELDSYNHLFHLGGNLVSGLLEYRIEIDDEEVSLKTLFNIIPKLSEYIISINQWAKQADWKEKTQKYAAIYWFRKSPLRDLLGVPSDLSESVVRNIEAGQVDERRLKNLTDKQIKYLIYSFI